MLEDTESICVATIFQDSVDRLRIISRLLSVPIGTESRISTKMSTAVTENFDTDIMAKASRHELFPKDLKNEIQTKATYDEELFKLQRDRSFLEDIIETTNVEIKCNNTYNVLLGVLETESLKKADHQSIVKREESRNKQIASLQQLLRKTKIEQEDEIRQCRNLVAALADQLREAKVRTNLEEIYVSNQSAATVHQNKKKLVLAEKEILANMEKLRAKVKDETTITTAIDKYIHLNLEKLEVKMEYWMTKHETETEAKDREIDRLINARQAGTDRFALVHVLMEEYGKELTEARKEKERLRRLQEADSCRIIMIIRIQAWWRGVMVRQFRGPYKKLARFLRDRKAELKKKAQGK